LSLELKVVLEKVIYTFFLAIFVPHDELLTVATEVLCR
jgi:hypothetical protein